MKCYISYICTNENDSIQVSWMEFLHEYEMELYGMMCGV